MKRDSIIFYRSFYEAIKNLKKNEQLTIYSQIYNYAFDGIEGEIEGVPAAVWELIKPQITANIRRYENGLKGGRPVTKTKPKHNQTITKPLPNDNDNDNDNLNDNENDNDNDNGVRLTVKSRKGNGASTASKQAEQSSNSAFKNPSLEEVEKEIETNGFRVNGKRFFAYYDSKHWQTADGKPLYDWRGMLAVWDAHEVEPKKKHGFNDFEQRQYSNDELESLLLEIGGD